MQDVIAVQKQAFEDHEELKSLIAGDVDSIIKKGEVLKRIRDTQEYKYLGDGGYDTWSSYLADPDIGMSRSYAMQHIQIYEYFILEMNLSIQELRKLKNISLMRTVLMIVNRKALETPQALEVIEKAKVLSFSDFAREELNEDFIEGETIPTTPEQAIELGAEAAKLTPRIIICETCNKARIEYHEKEICQCDGVFHLTNLDTAV